MHVQVWALLLQYLELAEVYKTVTIVFGDGIGRSPQLFVSARIIAIRPSNTK